MRIHYGSLLLSLSITVLNMQTNDDDDDDDDDDGGNDAELFWYVRSVVAWHLVSLCLSKG